MGFIPFQEIVLACSCFFIKNFTWMSLFSLKQNTGYLHKLSPQFNWKPKYSLCVCHLKRNDSDIHCRKIFQIPNQEYSIVFHEFSLCLGNVITKLITVIPKSKECILMKQAMKSCVLSPLTFFFLWSELILDKYCHYNKEPDHKIFEKLFICLR